MLLFVTTIMKARYLTFFSYIGTKFRSSEKIWIKNGKTLADTESVQGIIEIALKTLYPLNYPQVCLASRTDGGVHALNSSAHVDLERPGKLLYDTNTVVYKLNNFFYKHSISLYIKDFRRVNDNFNARRKALSRTYLYRLAIPKSELSKDTSITQYIPIEEWKRCYFVRKQDFDIDKLIEASKCFVGYHDFTTFKKFDKFLQHKHNRRSLYSIDVRPGRPCVTSYTETKQSSMEYWDIEIRGRSFVHNQIRRIVATLLAAANGKVTTKDIELMLKIPSKHSWPSSIGLIPPDGLYLCNVEYNPEDLIYDPDRDMCENSISSKNEFFN